MSVPRVGQLRLGTPHTVCLAEEVFDVLKHHSDAAVRVSSLTSPTSATAASRRRGRWRGGVRRRRPRRRSSDHASGRIPCAGLSQAGLSRQHAGSARRRGHRRCLLACGWYSGCAHLFLNAAITTHGVSPQHDGARQGCAALFSEGSDLSSDTAASGASGRCAGRWRMHQRASARTPRRPPARSHEPSTLPPRTESRSAWKLSDAGGIPAYLNSSAII